MTRKFTLILMVSSLLVFALMGMSIKASLMRLTVINKSAYPVHIWLNEFTPLTAPLATYYLNLDGVDPLTQVWVERVYTLVRGLYNMKVSYCDQEEFTNFKVDLTRNYRIVIPACANTPLPGEDNILKLNPQLYAPDSDIQYILIDSPFKWRY